MTEAPHLVARFFDVLTARALTPMEQAEVAAWLRSDAERDAFWSQPIADQRHGLGAARYVSTHAPDRHDLLRAALLHDVGKRHARLGIIGRVIASLVRIVGSSGSGRVRTYLAHGSAAAVELAGAEAIVVEYARHHHDARPPSISADDWAILSAADGVRR